MELAWSMTGAERSEVDATPSPLEADATAEGDASNGAALSFVIEGAPESLEFAVASCMAALVSIIHLPMMSANEPAWAHVASKANTAPAVALRIPGFI